MISVIIPCYNEKDSIAQVLRSVNGSVSSIGMEFEIIVVDDNSPDGTAEVAGGMKNDIDRLKIVKRPAKKDISSAVLEGIRNSEGRFIVVMDADMSHPPEKIPDLVRPLVKNECDIAIASRYTEGGCAPGWPLSRRLLSRFFNTVTGLITDVKDATSGFLAFKRSVIENVALSPRGQKIGLEILARGVYGKVKEIPYEYVDRKHGNSKLCTAVLWANTCHTAHIIMTANRWLRGARLRQAAKKK